MAQPGFDDPVPGDSAAKLTAQNARQGQNVKGMIWVLIVGMLLVVVAYAVMLALQATPVTVGNQLPGSGVPQQAAPADPMPQAGQSAEDATAPETAKSPE